MTYWLRTSSLVALAAAFILAGCGEGPVSSNALEAPATEAPVSSDIFSQAAEQYEVPASLLASIGYTETRWEMVEGHEEFEGMPPAFGLMALRGENLREGARLARLSENAVRTQPQANVFAAAALLSKWADEAGIDRMNLDAWAPIAARYSGVEMEEAREHYVREGVYKVLREGVRVMAPDGTVRGEIRPQKTSVQPLSQNSLQKSTDYGPAIWRPSPNYSNRPSGSTPDMVIIHTCEGSYAGCWGWLTNSAAGASAHYVVNETGSELSQLVRESKKSWHIGASYDCTLNSNVMCSKNGQSSNNFTIGIEHAGYASQSTWNTGLLQTSADLSCELSEDYSIPRDQYHFVGHGQLQPYNRTDPGANWPWTDYLNRINTACGGSGGGSEIIVDSNNNLNNTSEGYISVSSNWNSSSHSTDYNTGYWWAQTAAVSDGASFWFYMPSAGTRTIDAWWVAGTNRAPSAPFIMYNASGSSVGSTNVNMQANGGKWNTLGTYSFTAGWNRVMLSRWTTTGYVVIADAVRVRP